MQHSKFYLKLNFPLQDKFKTCGCTDQYYLLIKNLLILIIYLLYRKKILMFLYLKEIFTLLKRRVL